MANGSSVTYKELIQVEPWDMWQLVEVPVTRNGLQKVPLPDVQQLRSMEGQNIIVKQIQLVTPKVLTHAVIQEGVNAPLAELQKMSLIVFSRGWQRGQIIPILFLNNMADSDSTAATTIPYSNMGVSLNNWEQVDWPQSFIQFGNGLQSANTPYNVLLLVKYLKLDSKGQPILTGS